MTATANMSDSEDEAQTSRGLGSRPNKKAKMNNGSSTPTSFAARMMAKMGYKEGEGLGATGRGRLAPIQTQTRPQGAGLGVVREKTKQAKEEEKREAAFRGEVLQDSSEEERTRRKKEKERRKTLGGINGSSTSRTKAKPKYRTVADIEAGLEGLQVPSVLKSIIDLSGRETKLLAESGVTASSGFMVPSETEAEKLAKRARRDLEALADEWAVVQERKKYLDMESAQLIGEIDAHQQELEKLKTITTSIQQLEELSLHEKTPDAATWDAVTKKLESMEIDNNEDDVSNLGLQEVVVAAIHPLFRASMAAWNPLEDPAYLVPYLSRLQHLLGIHAVEEENSLALRNGHHTISRTRKSTTPYETLIYTLWLPPVRTAITNSWDVYDSSPLVTLIDAWRPLLPPFILSNIIDQLVVHRLSVALSEWKPPRAHKKSKEPSKPAPDVWLFPWLDFPYLSQQHLSTSNSTSLISALKHKYRSLLTHVPLALPPPPYLSAMTNRLPNLAPALLTRHLLPRLSAQLAADLVIDPSDQDLSPLSQVLSFAPLFSSQTFAELVIATLFPKWHATLHLWLTSPQKNYTEIAEWYQWWKAQIPAAVAALPSIQAEWAKALAMMDAAMALGDRAATELPPPDALPASSAHANGTGAPGAGAAPATPGPAATKKALLPETTFRDVVEDWCQEEGLLMMPLREAHATTGAPLWRITASANGKGGVVVYVKGDVLWARGKKDREVWEPIGLDGTLIERAGG